MDTPLKLLCLDWGEQEHIKRGQGSEAFNHLDISPQILDYTDLSNKLSLSIMEEYVKLQVQFGVIACVRVSPSTCNRCSVKVD